LWIVRVQLIYGPEKIAQDMHNSVTLILGIWHPYKVACERLYQQFLPTVWAPIVHEIDGKSGVLYKPQLVQMVTLFTQARLAYPSFRTKLPDLVKDPHLLPVHRTHAENLLDMFEYFIPAVRIDSVKIL
jgi:hypothetical protein